VINNGFKLKKKEKNKYTAKFQNDDRCRKHYVR